MFPLTLLFSLALVLCILPGGYAGPACTRKYYQTTQCVQKCQTRWGYPGTMMGSNPWGVVMQPVDDDSKDGWKSVIAEACGMTTSSSSTKSKSKDEEEEEEDPEIAGAVGSDPLVEESSVDNDDEPASTLMFGATAAPSSFLTSSSVSIPKSVSTSRTSPKTTAAPKTTAQPPKKAAPSPPSTKAAPPKTTAQAPPPADNDDSGSSNQGGDIGEYLKGHNDFRRQHGAAPLTWSDKLAGKAQEWANKCVFKHSGGTLGPFGENLAAGTGSAYGIANAIKSWTDEVKDYNAQSPEASHFTQVVWKNSKQVGCASAQCSNIFDPKFGEAKFVVCEYDPPGNFNNDFARNVQV